METETLSSRNAVDLLFKEEFNAGLCPSSKTPVDQVDGEDQEILQMPQNESISTEDFVLDAGRVERGSRGRRLEDG